MCSNSYNVYLVDFLDRHKLLNELAIFVETHESGPGTGQLYRITPDHRQIRLYVSSYDNPELHTNFGGLKQLHGIITHGDLINNLESTINRWRPADPNFWRGDLRYIQGFIQGSSGNVIRFLQREGIIKPVAHTEQWLFMEHRTLSLWSGDIHICSGDLQISFKTQDLYCKVLKSPSLEYVLCSSSLLSASHHRVLPTSRQSANVVHQRIQVFTATLSTTLLVARVQVSATISTCYNRIPLVQESAGRTTLQLSFRSSLLDVLKSEESSRYNLDSPLEGQLRSCLLGSGMWEENSQWIFPTTNMSFSKMSLQ